MIIVILLLLMIFTFTRMFIFNLHNVLLHSFKDLFYYIKLKKWNTWNGFGLRIYTGMFGTGKTLSAVKYVVANAKRYNLNVLSNINLVGIEYTPLVNYQQIINSPSNTIILIDEISTVFNARTWKDFNINLLFQLLQCRKNKKELVCTAQRFGHVDKLIRDITLYTIECSKRWRFQNNKFYDAFDLEQVQISSKLKNLANIWWFVNDKHYAQYDTSEIIDNAKKTTFISNDEILNRRQPTPVNIELVGLNKKAKKQLKKA